MDKDSLGYKLESINAEIEKSEAVVAKTINCKQGIMNVYLGSESSGLSASTTPLIVTAAVYVYPKLRLPK